MSEKKGGFGELFFETIMPKIYGLGAAVVIVGAMFKIMHWEGANLMLIIGLSTEAMIFVFSAFEPKHFEPDWTKVYPELGDDEFGEVRSGGRNRGGDSGGSGDGVARKMDKMLESANIGPDLLKSLGDGMKNLATNAGKMANLSDASVATTDYASKVKEASKSLTDMNKSYANTMTAMTAMADATKDAKQYHSVVQNVTKNLSALNAMYEMELGDANSHLKSMNKFYQNISQAMESMSDASKESEKFKLQMTGLTSNITSLNTVYGNMLSAMRVTTPAAAPQQKSNKTEVINKSLK